MKFSPLLATLALVLSFHTAHAGEMEDAANEAALFCNEQVMLSGLEDEAEKNEYYQECMDSYNAPEGDMLIPAE